MRWLDTIENYMRADGVCVGYVESRDKWRSRSKVADPQIVRRKTKEKRFILKIIVLQMWSK